MSLTVQAKMPYYYRNG